MLDQDWMVDLHFFHLLTGLNLDFLDKFLISNKEFNLKNITDIAVIRER